MVQSAKKTFLQGAVTLVVANIIVKVIGALYTIPLTNIIGRDGIGYYSAAYEIYSFLFILSTAGLPIAVSKLVSENYALQNYGDVKKTFQLSMSLFFIVGLAGSLLMFFGARGFAGTMNNDLAYAAIMAVAPSVFFIALMSTYRGFFQGLSDMLPTAISQVIEAVLKLGAGFVVALMLIRAKSPIHIVSAGAISGVTLGTVLGALYLMAAYMFSPSVKKLNRLCANQPSVKSNREILHTIIKYAIPITIGASALSLTNILDLFIVMNRLGDIGFSQVEANAINGAYSMARKLFNLPPSIIASLGVSVIPVLSGYYALKNMSTVKKTMESALRICLTFAIPAGFGLFALAGPILSLLYFNEPEGVLIATPLLTKLGIAVVFVSLVSLTNAMLQAIGLVNVPVFTMFIGGIIKLTTNYTLIGIPKIGINGAPVGTILCYGTITTLNLIILFRKVKIVPNFGKVFIKPIISGILMIVFCIVVYNLSFPIIGLKLATVFSIVVSGTVYFVILILIKGLDRDDLLMLPKGKKIADFFEKKGLI